MWGVWSYCRRYGEPKECDLWVKALSWIRQFGWSVGIGRCWTKVQWSEVWFGWEKIQPQTSSHGHHLLFVLGGDDLMQSVGVQNQIHYGYNISVIYIGWFLCCHHMLAIALIIIFVYRQLCIADPYLFLAKCLSTRQAVMQCIVMQVMFLSTFCTMAGDAWIAIMIWS